VAGGVEAPERGAVIRYAYLWADADAQGRDEADKDRPVLVLALSVHEADGKTEVLVVAITHTSPANPSDAVPLPREIKSRIGLDEAPAWVVTTEANAFFWPGPDLRPVPGRHPATVTYGYVTPRFLKRVATSYLANRTRQRRRLVRRTT
jgi:mRNA-degrading endonuclease toxin of MazEF toxin-antitoxin module